MAGLPPRRGVEGCAACLRGDRLSAGGWATRPRARRARGGGGLVAHRAAPLELEVGGDGEQVWRVGSASGSRRAGVPGVLLGAARALPRRSHCANAIFEVFMELDVAGTCSGRAPCTQAHERIGGPSAPRVLLILPDVTEVRAIHGRRIDGNRSGHFRRTATSPASPRSAQISTSPTLQAGPQFAQKKKKKSAEQNRDPGASFTPARWAPEAGEGPKSMPSSDEAVVEHERARARLRALPDLARGEVPYTGGSTRRAERSAGQDPAGRHARSGEPPQSRCRCWRTPPGECARGPRSMELMARLGRCRSRTPHRPTAGTLGRTRLVGEVRSGRKRPSVTSGPPRRHGGRGANLATVEVSPRAVRNPPAPASRCQRCSSSAR